MANRADGPGRTPGTVEVSGDQALAFRLRRHHLEDGGRSPSLPDVLRDMGGAQAQLLSAAQLSVWTRRRSHRPEDLVRALGPRRTVVKAWCMRRTLHLVPSRDLPVFLRGTARRSDREVVWLIHQGMGRKEVDRWVDAVVGSLDRPLTRGELATAVARRLGGRLATWRGDGWGNRRRVPAVRAGSFLLPVTYLLHVAGTRGNLCSGPSRGAEATFVRADAWAPGWTDIDPDRAEEELLRRYLRAYAPARPEDFAAWSGLRRREVDRAWERVGGSLTPVRTGPSHGFALSSDLRDLERPPPDEAAVRLLPYFDSYLLGHADRELAVPAAHHPRVYRPQGWVAPTLLVGGRVAGVWGTFERDGRPRLRIELFRPLGRDVRGAVEREAAATARYLGLDEPAIRLVGRDASR